MQLGRRLTAGHRVLVPVVGVRVLPPQPEIPITMPRDYLKRLNPSQLEAVTHPEGPLLVLAGPGSGKTRVIAHRIAWLIDNLHVHLENILAVTFTNKAAGEIKKRVRTLSDGAGGGMWMGTFHSICLRILKAETDSLSGYTEDFVVYDQDDQMRLLKDCLKELDYGKNFLVPKNILFEFDKLENGTISSFREDFYGDALRSVYNLFKSELVRRNAMTFNDLLRVTLKLLQDNEGVCTRYQSWFSHVLVDEYQDTNPVQYGFVQILSKRHRNIFVVGDDSQSIYGWRGADLNNILDFERDFPGAKVVKLERNYRSTENILCIANSVIERNLRRKEKTLWTENPKGEKAVLFRAGDSEDEAFFVASRISHLVESKGLGWDGIAVFYRANFQSRVIEDALRARRIPYRIVSGVGFYQRAEIKDVIAYLRLVQNPSDDVSFERIVNVPPRRIGEATVSKLRGVARTDGFALTDAVRYCGEHELLPDSAQSALCGFMNILEELRDAARDRPAAGVIKLLLDRTKYIDYLGNDHPRVENVNELLAAAEIAEDISLSDFLDLVLLSTDEDRADSEGKKVSLMTIHAAQGLEFPAVFVVGVNDGLLPHSRAAQTLSGTEEERRLFYVAITRAEKYLHISHYSKKAGSGPGNKAEKSIFLDDIPPAYLTHESRRKELSKPYSGRTHDASSPPRSAPASSSKNAGQGFRSGQKVEHEIFGPGTVKKVNGKGEDAVVTVSFLISGVKKIVASFLIPS